MVSPPRVLCLGIEVTAMDKNKVGAGIFGALGCGLLGSLIFGFLAVFFFFMGPIGLPMAVGFGLAALASPFLAGTMFARGADPPDE